MFESLSDKLKRTLKNLRGEGVLTPAHVDAALREIRLALLEADVNYKVAKDFIASVKEKAEGQQVWQELKPSEQVVKIVFDELVELLGGTSSRLVFTKTSPNVVMIVGLQGSGKTTSTGKIAMWLAKNAQRILGMGDVLSLIEEVQSKVDQSEAEAQLEKLQKNKFTLDDFRTQLRQVKRMGSFSKLMKMLPDQLLGGIGMPQLDDEQSAEMEKQLKRTEAIIDSMTRKEREDHRILNAGRRRRVARGSGTSVTEVNQLIKQYVEMRQMMQQLSRSGLFGNAGGGGGGLKGRMMRRMAGMMGMPDMGAMMGGGGEDDGGGGLPAGLPSAPGRKKKK